MASNVGGLPDVIRDGETGWLVPSGNPRALASAIGDALDNGDEARSRAARGQTLARQLLDVGTTGREVARIYQQILAQSDATAAPQ